MVKVMFDNLPPALRRREVHEVFEDLDVLVWGTPGLACFQISVAVRPRGTKILTLQVPQDCAPKVDAYVRGFIKDSLE